MDASRVGRLRRAIARELRAFDDCFARSEGHGCLPCDIGGQLGLLALDIQPVIPSKANEDPKSKAGRIRQAGVPESQHFRAADRLVVGTPPHLFTVREDAKISGGMIRMASIRGL